MTVQNISVHANVSIIYNRSVKVSVVLVNHAFFSIRTGIM